MYGLNLTVPEDAKAIIKPWDEREDTTKYADSNVDDQVSRSHCSYPMCAKRNDPPGGHTYTIHTERPSEIYLSQTRYARLAQMFSLVTNPLLYVGRGELAPRHLRIYANHAAIVDFEDAEVTKPQLNITLQEGEVGVIEYPLNTPAFANIHSLSVFFVRTVSKLVE